MVIEIIEIEINVKVTLIIVDILFIIYINKWRMNVQNGKARSFGKFQFSSSRIYQYFSPSNILKSII